ncbi:glycine cleavage system protein GcvH [Eubacterium sp. 1001713B170207_170306_E7]|uniref:glycine cleavage system protein GcvH n=1 Tax=Eubacterium sp. 1001713B170207_170306_E7 TaxID=2787097 RepID=UPI0018983E7F|nr:glycine cleavage system protein GcvH [Eubacterium sp. 1001713B170207_170306_E7]
MKKDFCVLPCNGLDKFAGSLTREVALRLLEDGDHELICPVLYHAAEKRYRKALTEKPLLVIDGCSTKCASKLAVEKHLKVAERINVSDSARERGFLLTDYLEMDESAKAFVNTLAESFQEKPDEGEVSAFEMPAPIHYKTFFKGKFIFKVPESHYYFNENDCWALVKNGIARVGVTDFIQQNLSDILFVDFPEVGRALEQFDDVGSVESGKSIFELVSPVSGVVTAINTELEQSPELVNESPYEAGWIAEIRLTHWEEDTQMLIRDEAYYEIIKRKVDEIEL